MAPSAPSSSAPLGMEIRTVLQEELARFAIHVLRPELHDAIKRIEQHFENGRWTAHTSSDEDVQTAFPNRIDMDMQTGFPKIAHMSLATFGRTEKEGSGQKVDAEGNGDKPTSVSTPWVARLRKTVSGDQQQDDEKASSKGQLTPRRARAGYAKAATSVSEGDKANDSDVTPPSSARALLSEARNEGKLARARSTVNDDDDDDTPVGVPMSRDQRRLQLQSLDALIDEEEELADNAADAPGRLGQLVSNRWFDWLGVLVIFANLMTMGIQADYSLKHVGEPLPRIFKDVSFTFCVIFSIEILMRIFGEGPYKFFVTSRNLSWNYFDLCIVSFQVLEDGVSRFYDVNRSGYNFSILRLCRVLRTFRILRIARVCKFISELRILLVTLKSSLRSLFWTSVLLFVSSYSFSLFVIELIVDRSKIHSYTSEEEIAIAHYFGSMGETMMTLYMVVSNGLAWRYPAEVLGRHVNEMAVAFFGLFILFTVFALLNIVSGIFLNTAMATAESDRHSNMVEQIRTLFECGDTDGSGELSLDEFQAQLDDPEMEMYLKGMGWHRDQALELFGILDVDRSGEINLVEFIAGCTRLQGETKAVDFAAFMCEFDRMNSRLQEHMHLVEKVLHFLETKSHLTGAEPHAGG